MSGVLGKNFQDRERSARVRNLALDEIEGILTGKKRVSKRFKEAMILKLAGTVLPRLNEHTGEGGGPVQFTIVKYGDASIQVPTTDLSSSFPSSV